MVGQRAAQLLTAGLKNAYTNGVDMHPEFSSSPYLSAFLHNLTRVMLPHKSIAEEQTPGRFDWSLGNKIRDGRYGPVFVALRTDTAELITAEKLILDEPGTSSVTRARVLSHLESKTIYQNQPNVVSYLGHQLKERHLFVLTEYLTGGPLQDFVQGNGAVPQPLARMILRQIVLGLEQM